MMLALAIAPQRTTLYGSLARFLVVPELLASPLGPRVREWDRQALAGQDWLVIDVDGDLSDADRAILWRLGTVAGVYDYFPSLADTPGPFLRPQEPRTVAFVPQEIIETRRYRGKTNELFTAVLLNLALFASDFAGHPADRLRILDPLSGGGTTLFTALVRGYDAVGIEREKEDFDTTNAYVQQFLNSVGVPFKRTEERVRWAGGRRAVFIIGRKEATRLLGLVHGDTFAAPELLADLPGGVRFHAIVTDLPYGIQHQGHVRRFLEEGLHAWAATLLPGGTIACAWEASTLRRAEAIALAEQHSNLRVVSDPPYDALEHPVDRQIKRRDILVIRKEH